MVFGIGEATDAAKKAGQSADNAGAAADNAGKAADRAGHSADGAAKAANGATAAVNKLDKDLGPALEALALAKPALDVATQLENAVLKGGKGNPLEALEKAVGGLAGGSGNPFAELANTAKAQVTGKEGLEAIKQQAERGDPGIATKGAPAGIDPSQIAGALEAMAGKMNLSEIAGSLSSAVSGMAFGGAKEKSVGGIIPT